MKSKAYEFFTLATSITLLSLFLFGREGGTGGLRRPSGGFYRRCGTTHSFQVLTHPFCNTTHPMKAKPFLAGQLARLHTTLSAFA